MHGWKTGDAGLGYVVEEQTKMCLKVYAEDPSRIRQDANNERRISQGGYAARQLEELVQNATDAARKGGGRVEVFLSDYALYVANDGEAFSEQGVRSVMASDISAKNDEQIGKFGIGFKSLLAVSDEPRVFSRSISFGFDHAWATEVLRGEGYDVEHYPTMRLARVLDPVADGSAADSVLAQMMEWASTVVVAPLAGVADGLAARLAQFSPEFILFSPHLKQVRLRSAVAGSEGQEALLAGDRTVERIDAGNGFVGVRSGDKTTTWSVASKQIAVSSGAFEEAGHVAGRRTVDVQYAVQYPPSKSDGTFWAYFPTEYKTTLSGIVNAPWKLSDDRRHLLDSLFNRELLQVLPELVGEALARFSDPEQGVSILDALPSRGGELGAKEARNWADEIINGPIFAHMRSRACLLSAAGTLRRPKDLNWLADLGVDSWLREWAETPGAPLADWLHPAAYSAEERRLKVSRLMGTGAQIDVSAAGLDDWLEALVVPNQMKGSAHAIRLAARMLRDDEAVDALARRSRGKDRAAYASQIKQQVESARILMLEDGSMAVARKGTVFIRVPGEDSSDAAFVSPELAAEAGVSAALNTLGVVLRDRSGQLRQHIQAWKAKRHIPGSEQMWANMWPVLRDLPVDAALNILREDLEPDFKSDVRVRTRAGKWVKVGEAFLPGRLVPADGSRDAEFLIDPREHSSDDELLRHLGAVDLPRTVANGQREPWYQAWEDAARDHLAQSAGLSDASRAEIDAPSTVTWPLEPVTRMSAAAKQVVTSLLLMRGLPAPVPVRFKYGDKSIRVIGPETYFLRLHAVFQTTHGLLPAHHVLLPVEGLREGVFPKVDLDSDTARHLGISESLDKLPAEAWQRMKQTVDSWRTPDRDDDRAHFYAWCLFQGPAGLLDTMVVPVGRDRKLADAAHIGVTTSRATMESLIDAGLPGLFLEDPDDLEQFVEVLGMPRGEQLLQEEIIAEPAGEEVFLTDAYPPLRLRLEASDQSLKLQPVSRLVRMTSTPKGQVARPLPSRREGDVVFVTATDKRLRLLQTSDAVGLNLTSADADSVLASMEKAATDKLRTAIKRCKNDDERLVLAAGEEALRRSVPAQALATLDQEREGAAATEVAALSRAVHGVGILKHLRAVLEENGLEPPKEWAGRRLTRQWVDGLGFPSDWAGFPGSQRAAVEMIDGPAVLKPLHPYQEFVTERIEALLHGVGADRGVVSLPTGAGKTRVTVEALVNAVRNDLIRHDQPLIWIAQTDELCEQAAETWTFVWRAIGPSVPMRLGRLWGTNEVSEEPGSFQLIIATTAKLLSLVEGRAEDYRWLTDPSVVVVDEAHTSTASSYTQVLEWLGRGNRGRNRSVRRPLIGLTATPFRGRSAEETERLVKRYDGNRLDRGAFVKQDPYEELQDMGVLAQVRHEILAGVDVMLSENEKHDIQKLSRLPAAVSDRLGSDMARTLRVVDHIASLPDDWTVIAFAPSVENARVLAALLAHRGISAVSISSDTETAARRHYVDEFKAGRIRVLTNFNVLTQGFDAPRVQAVYVARPTFSPNVYQQMIGRGLRGPLNGGSEEVLIVNVKDNFEQFGDLLAFNEFEYLWAKR